jgi:DNA-binding transcriptional LysR family regulator
LVTSVCCEGYGRPRLPDGCVDATLRGVNATIDGMRTLAAVFRRRSMSAAANELGVDKGTVSRRLAALERERPGLFERRAGRIEPTETGALALAALEDVERDLARLEEALDSDRSSRGTVRLTVPAPIASHLVVPALPSLRETHPEIDVVLLATSRVLDVGRGEADVAVRNVVPTGGGIVSRKVARVTAALYGSRSYLANRGTPEPRSLDGHDFVDFEQGTYAQAPFEWLPAAVRRARVVLRADDPTILTRAVASGLGVGALPAFLADDEPELVRVGDDVSITAVHVVVREGVRRLARVRTVATWVGELMTARLAWLVRGR